LPDHRSLALGWIRESERAFGASASRPAGLFARALIASAAGLFARALIASLADKRDKPVNAADMVFWS